MEDAPLNEDKNTVQLQQNRVPPTSFHFYFSHHRATADNYFMYLHKMKKKRKSAALLIEDKTRNAQIDEQSLSGYLSVFQPIRSGINAKLWSFEVYTSD